MKRYIMMALGAALALNLSTASLAQEQFTVWRWVDQNGITHYTQSEPQGVEAERVTLRQARREQARQEAASNSRQQRQEPAAAQPENIEQRQQAYREEVAQFCREARDALGDLTGTPRILVTPPDGGDPYLMTEDERQAEIRRLEQEIEQTCSENNE